jgi:UDP-N-acetylglucosamine/UDP-N-acetylgalactosamine diphosphorylase
VGPCRIAFGTIIAAGSIYRKDETEPGRLLMAGSAKSGRLSFHVGFYRSIRRTVHNNLIYLANLLALQQWYKNVRSLFIGADLPRELWEGLCRNLVLAIKERTARMAALADNMPGSIQIYRKIAGIRMSQAVIDQQQALVDHWERIEALLEFPDTEGEDQKRRRDAFLAALQIQIDSRGNDYLTVIKGLPGETAELGSTWLQGVVDHFVAASLAVIPELQ